MNYYLRCRTISFIASNRRYI